MDYPWYVSLAPDDTDLLQGDLLPDCPIIIPPKALQPDGEYDIDIVDYNVVVVSQCCDLENGKVENVLVCPYYTFRDAIKQALTLDEQKSKKSITKFFDELRKGNQPNYHLLSKDEDKSLTDCIVVDFRNVFAVHIDFLKSHVETLTNRVRLLPPYREHLSQAFARFFMRVGLPQNIPPIEAGNYSN